MSRATRNLGITGAVLVVIGAFAAVAVVLFHASVMVLIAIPSLALGVTILLHADKRAHKESAYDREITARAAHHVLGLREYREKQERNESVGFARRRKKVADEKRKGPKKEKKRSPRYQLYACRFCDWEGVRFIRKKNGQKICPACRQPVRKA